MAIVKATYPGINPPEKTRIQVTNVVLANADVSVTAEQLLNFLLTMTPTAPRTIILPPAADIVALLTHATVADGLEFQIRNFGAAVNTITVVPNGGLSGSAVLDGGSYKTFILRLDSVSSAAPTYTLNDMGTSGAGPAAGGNVVGPASSTDNAVAVFDGVTGKIIKETLAADPLRAVSDANDNVLIGTGTAFAAIAAGAIDNTVLGADAAPLLTTGPRNVLIGNGVAPVLTIGTANVIIGQLGGSSAASGDNNVMIGGGTVVLAATTSDATAVGVGAGAGDCGVSIGADAFAGTDGGQIVIGCGGRAGANCVIVGFSAGSSGATDSVAIGENALDDATAGKAQNVAIGNTALTALTTGDNNVCMGHAAGILLTTGSGNVLIGNEVSPSLTTAATDNVIIGSFGAVSAATGDRNVIIGTGTDLVAATTSDATVVGDQASAGTCGVSIGQGAQAGTDGAQIIIGCSGRGGANCVTIGLGAGSSGATDSIAIGENALDEVTAGKAQNVAIGNDALTALTTGDNNVCMGHQAGNLLTTGTGNVLIGHDADATANTISGAVAVGLSTTAAAEAVAIGDVANAATTGAIAIGNAAAATVGDGNIAIGTAASASGTVPCVAIGAGVANSTAASVQFPTGLTAGSNTVAHFSAADGGTLFPFSSTIRIKTDVEDLATTLDPEVLYQIRPVAFHLKKTPDAPWKQFGFIAEDMAKIMPQVTGFGYWVNPETGVQETEITPTSVDYSSLCAPIIVALQQQKSTIEKLEARIVALEK